MRVGIKKSVLVPKGIDTDLPESSSNEAVIKSLLQPLTLLNCRERAIFIEYHYFKTHMKFVAASHKISLGRAYEILYKAEEKLTRPPEEKTKFRLEPGGYRVRVD